MSLLMQRKVRVRVNSIVLVSFSGLDSRSRGGDVRGKLSDTGVRQLTCCKLQQQQQWQRQCRYVNEQPAQRLYLVYSRLDENAQKRSCASLTHAALDAAVREANGRVEVMNVRSSSVM